MGDTVTLTKNGASTDVPVEEAQSYIDRGWSQESSDQRAERVDTAARKEAEGTAAPLIMAGLRGATFGLSDAAVRAIGGTDATRELRQMAEDNPGLSKLGELGGALATGSVIGKLGAAVEGATGSRIAATAAEGAIYGAGSGVSQVALSDDPITAEHIVSSLGSNAFSGAVIGGGIGGATKLGGKILGRARQMLEEAGAARSAIEGLPEDLAGLDEKGLKAAAETERSALKTAADEERSVLEAQRGEARKAIADEVKQFHDTLAEESPIFHSVQGEDVAAIDGVKDIKVQLAKSFKTMRAQFDDPIGVAKDPQYLLKPLRMRQAALEALEPKIPELQSVLGTDARAAALDQVGEALAKTKDQIARIEQIAGPTKAPLMSDKLAQLTSGTSPRLEAIDAAREALKKAPEMGLLQKGAKAGAFAGVTALAHAIPGVGIAAPFIGKGASDLVGKLFTHLGAGVKAASERSGAALKSFLTVGAKMEAPAVASAVKVLNSVRFAPTSEKEESSDNLLASYQKRADELRSQTTYAVDGETVMRPEARMALAQHLAPIAAVSPTLADKIETAQARKVSYLSAALPKHPEVGGMQIGPDNWHPSELEMRAFARKVRAAEDPHSVEERLAAGIVTPEEAEAYRTVYPEKFAAMQEAIATAAPQLSKTLPVKKKVALYVFTGVPTMPALQPNVFKQLQSNFTSEPGSMNGQASPKPAPNFGALGSLKDLDKPTRAQQRAD